MMVKGIHSLQHYKNNAYMIKEEIEPGVLLN